MSTKLRHSCALVLILSLGACGPAPKNISAPMFSVPDGISFIESVEKKNEDVIIPFKKFRLENGLTVVLHQDRSDPIVHVDITYHVGSAREDIGKSGFAHFFEHMMFQGSENVADEEHIKIISEAGGSFNGSTSLDRTNYYETVPSNELEKVLWLEADRMGYFLDAVTSEKFENQRETVKNERGERVDNAPYGLLRERVGEALYPEGHPYSWSTIGYIEDLNRATLDDLKKFFLRWYGPNNATLTIGGDLDEATTLAWVEKYFGSIPAGPAVDKPEYLPVTLDADRYISLEDNVQLPLLYVGLPTVHAGHPDEPSLDVLANILGGDESSLLYKNVTKPSLGVGVSARNTCAELNCTFELRARANPDKIKKLADLEAIFRETLAEFETSGVREDDLTKFKASTIARVIRAFGSVRAKVSALAHYETFDDNPNGIGAYIQRYEDVTKDDVMRVYKKYIKNKPAVIMSIVPKGQIDTIAKPDTWQRYARSIPTDTASDNYAWELPKDDFDRSVMPPSGEIPSFQAPDVYRIDLKNGINVLGTINDEVPITNIQLILEVGQKDEPLDKLGLAMLTKSMLNDATESMSAEEIADERGKLGSFVFWTSDDFISTLVIDSLTKNVDATIKLAMGSIQEPKFAQEDFERLKTDQINSIEASKDRANVTADDVFNLIMYGRENSFPYSDLGTVETVSSITLEDVKAFYRTYYSPKTAKIVTVSNLGESAIKKALKPLSSWEGTEIPMSKVAKFPDLGGTKIYFIDKPGAAQSEIRIGKRARPFDATGEYYRATLMNYPMGGSFNSRINQNLREDKGYTYGARSRFQGDAVRGEFIAGAGVRADATVASITEFVDEINDFHKNGMTEEELSFTKNTIGKREAGAYESSKQKLGYLSNIVTHNLNPSYVDEQSRILEGVSKDELNALASKYLNIDEMVMVVVGDKAKYWDEVKALGYPVIELDQLANPL